FSAPSFPVFSPNLNPSQLPTHFSQTIFVSLLPSFSPKPQAPSQSRRSPPPLSELSVALPLTNSPNSDDVVDLPLFLLPLVLFGAIFPLQIFQFRYRIMMHTLLQTDLRFGVIYTDAVSGTVASWMTAIRARNGDVARGPAISLHRPRSGRASHRDGDLHEGRCPIIQLVRKETGEGDWGFEKNLFPTTFSFFVGSTFEGAPWEQQALNLCKLLIPLS
ncbi:hypothetical protein V8G54_028172, partial [Vigna mungo]